MAGEKSEGNGERRVGGVLRELRAELGAKTGMRMQGVDAGQVLNVGRRTQGTGH